MCSYFTLLYHSLTFFQRNLLYPILLLLPSEPFPFLFQHTWFFFFFYIYIFIDSLIVPCKATHIPTHNIYTHLHSIYTHTSQGVTKGENSYNIFIQIVQNVIYRLYIPYIIHWSSISSCDNALFHNFSARNITRKWLGKEW